MAKGKRQEKPARTAVMQQYFEAKEAYPGCLILFRMGDFYETFEEDAKTAADILGIALTKRSNKGRAQDKGPASDIPLAGFPFHALDAHLHKLIRAGLKVAICEQVEDPKLAKGIVKRAVVEVVTPGTAMEERFLDRDASNYLACVVRDGEVAGLALLENSTGEFFIEELAVNRLRERFNRYQPAEVLVAEGEAEQNRLLGNYQGMVTPYQDWLADLENANHELTEHFGTVTLKGFGVDDLPLGVAAAGVALHYVHRNSPGTQVHISSLRKVSDEKFMGLDAFTVRNLELFKSLATQGTHGTLISVIDATCTAQGARLLKHWLKGPLNDKAAIEERLDRVAELVANEPVRRELRDLLRGINDLERILGRLSTGRANPRDVANLANGLEITAHIKKTLTQHELPALSKLFDHLEDTSDLVVLVRAALMDAPPINLAKGNFIRSGYNEELDELRGLASSGKKWIAELQARERQRTDIPSLKIGFNNVFGYYIEVTRTHQDKVPEDYIRKQTLVNAERYITPELKEYEEKVLTAEERSLALEKTLFDGVVKAVLERAGQVQSSARLVAMTDVAAGLAETAGRYDYCRPALSDEPSLKLRGSRHPVVETLLPVGERFTPNDLDMNLETSQIHVITGPNMAGKSTFLRQVGLIVAMAQAGSFVPAAEARIGLVDRVFTRVGASDNLAGGESTFLVEMVETANILHNASRHSLVLLDEIGRGTSTYDGLSIAWAVIEYLHQTTETACKTLFATHFHELVNLAESLPRIQNYNVAVKEHGREVVFLRKIIPGGTDRSYGIHVAQMAGLPRQVIDRAGEILSGMATDHDPVEPGSIARDDRAQIDLFSQREQALRKDFQGIDVNNLTPVEALNLLDKLKEKHGL